MKPIVWVDVLDHIETLHPGEHVSPTFMNAWLLSFWNRLNRPSPRYIPMEYINRQDPVTAEEIAEFRKSFGVEKSCPKQDLIGFIHNSGRGHYCFLYIASLNNIQLLGKETHEDGTEEGNWHEWHGTHIWRNMCLLHGWSYSLGLSIDKRNWVQNSYDNGPTTCQVVEHVWTHGVTWDVTGLWRKPNFPCGHVMRIRMGNDAFQMVKVSFEALSQLSKNELDAFLNIHGQDDTILSEIAVVERMLQHDSSASTNLQLNIKKNTDAMETCQDCTANLPALPKYRTMKQILDRYPALQGAKRHVGQPGGLEHNVQDSISSEDERPQVHNTQLGPQRQHRGTKDVAQTAIYRFARPIAPPHLPPFKRKNGLYTPFNWKYDDYQCGPTMDELEPISDTVIQLADKSLAYIAGKLLDIPWRLFRDYGYRLPPHFCQMFHLRDPFMVKQHLMGFVMCSTPTSTPTNTPSSTLFHDSGQTDLNSSPPNLYSTPVQSTESCHHTLPLSSLSNNSGQIDSNSSPTDLYSAALQSKQAGHPESCSQVGPPSSPASSWCQSTIETRRGEADITDSVTMGAEAMIQLSKDIMNDDIFVTGKTFEGKFITVDLQQDSVIPENINYAMDIDSLIWITRKPHFALAVELYTSPVFRNTAPISKDNHVKIEALYPPVEQGKRDEWWSRSFSLSRIPHALLGKIGKANLSIFLPRMIHQDPYTHKWANVVPPELQTEQRSRAQRGKAASELGPKGRGGVARVCNLFWAPIKCSPFFGRRS